MKTPYPLRIELIRRVNVCQSGSDGIAKRTFRGRLAIGIIILAVLLSGGTARFSLAGAPLSDDEINRVLASAESLFKAMQEKDYSAIWALLTEKTKQSITDSVLRELKKRGTDSDRSKIASDFGSGGALAKAYWGEYLFVFRPEMVLEQSKWSVGTIERDKVEINILYRKSEKPAVLQVYKEEGEWKVGLNETFGVRNMLPF